MFECRARAAHGTGPRARRLQDRESDTGYDTRRRAPDGVIAHLSQTAVCDTRPGIVLDECHRMTSVVCWT